MLTVESKIFVCMIIAFLFFIITAILIGEERKAKWFKKRTRYSFFLKRGFLGEFLHFGYPVTREGYTVVVILVALIGLSSYLVTTYL